MILVLFIKKFEEQIETFVYFFAPTTHVLNLKICYSHKWFDMILAIDPHGIRAIALCHQIYKLTKYSWNAWFHYIYSYVKHLKSCTFYFKNNVMVKDEKFCSNFRVFMFFKPFLEIPIEKPLADIQ